MILLLALACAAEPAPVPDPPQVIVIISDTTRADIGGAPLPAWWKDGREYTHAYSASNGTTASSVALLTGRLPASDEERRHPVGGEPPCEIPDDWRPGSMMRTAPADIWHSRLLTDQPVLARVYGGGSTTQIGKIGSEALVAEAIDAIGDPATGHALVVWARGPHEPVGDVLPSPRPYSVVASVDHELARQRRCGTVDAEHAGYWRLAYRSAAEHALAGVAPLIGAARASGATVIFTADHGEALGEDGRWGHATDLHDAQVRVPLIVWGPGVEPGTDSTPVPSTCVGQTARLVLGQLVPDACDLRTGDIRGDVVVGMPLADGTWDERVILPEVVP